MKGKIILSAALLAASSSASAIDFGVGVKAGTVGFGVDVSFVLTQTINFRLSATQADFSENDTIDMEDEGNRAQVDAKLDLDFGSTALLIDWYPFDGTFHVTAGMMKNNSKATVTGNLVGGTATIEGNTYDIATAFANGGATSGTLSFGDSFEPYVGIGWGRKADDDPGLSLSFEVGVVMMDPKIDLVPPDLQGGSVTATDSLGNTVTVDTTQFNADFTEAEATANQDLEDFEMYPVISLGLNYAF
jgi:hypothetical protein